MSLERLDNNFFEELEELKRKYKGKRRTLSDRQIELQEEIDEDYDDSIERLEKYGNDLTNREYNTVFNHIEDEYSFAIIELYNRFAPKYEALKKKELDEYLGLRNKYQKKFDKFRLVLRDVPYWWEED